MQRQQNGKVHQKKKTYKHSQFVEYKGAFIRKSTALYLLQENPVLSSDRLIRVRENQEKTSEPAQIKEIVTSGDLCVFNQVGVPGKILFGRMVQFTYLDGTKRQQEYSGMYVDMQQPSFSTYTLFFYKNDVFSFEAQYSYFFHFEPRVIWISDGLLWWIFRENFSHGLTLDKVGNALSIYRILKQTRTKWITRDKNFKEGSNNKMVGYLWGKSAPREFVYLASSLHIFCFIGNSIFELSLELLSTIYIIAGKLMTPPLQMCV